MKARSRTASPWSTVRKPFSRFSRAPVCERTMKARTLVAKPGCLSFVSWRSSSISLLRGRPRLTRTCPSSPQPGSANRRCAGRERLQRAGGRGIPERPLAPSAAPQGTPPPTASERMLSGSNEAWDARSRLESRWVTEGIGVVVRSTRGGRAPRWTRSGVLTAGPRLVSAAACFARSRRVACLRKVRHPRTTQQGHSSSVVRDARAFFRH
jgi:hypothetical protein